MTTIKATCPTCGEVGLTPDEVELWVHPTSREESFYAFTCPSCLCVVRKPADERVIRLLRTGGVEAREIAPPAPAKRPRFDGPRFDHDDLLDFHTLLEGDTWFDGLMALVQRDVAAAEATPQRPGHTALTPGTPGQRDRRRRVR